MAVAEAGAMPLIRTRHVEFLWNDHEEFWYEGTLALLKRCDAMILVPGWEDSKGTRDERAWAKANDMPVFERVEELKRWLDEGLPLSPRTQSFRARL